MAKKYIDADAYKEKLKLRQVKLSNRQAYRETPTCEFTHPGNAECSIAIRSPHEIMYTRIDGQLEGLDYAIEELDNMPSADVVEVVRCKDCKHLLEDEEIQDNYCELDLFSHLKSDFCNYGERRTDA